MHYASLTPTNKQKPKSSNHHPIRILHVVGGMNRGGIETWLIHILRHIDRDRFQIDFLVHINQSGTYDEEIRRLGSQIILCPHISLPWLYARNFKRILREYGPYDIVHSHLHHFSGYILRLAKQEGVPTRIAHSHSDTSLKQAKAGVYRRLYLMLMRKWVSNYATVGLAASSKAAVDLFGFYWQTNPRWQTLYCGIDLTLFQNPVSPADVRAELGIPTNAFVIGHVGRFAEPKNHLFLLEIAAEIAKIEPNMYLLIVGDGALRPQIEQKVVELGLNKRVILTGDRHDVPRLMLGAIDIFLFPSIYEGLPLVLMEVQAAGIPCVLSDVVSQEAQIIKPLIHTMSLSEPPIKWAEVILSIRFSQFKIPQMEALNRVKESKFNILNSVKNLENVYLNNTIQFANKK